MTTATILRALTWTSLALLAVTVGTAVLDLSGLLDWSSTSSTLLGPSAIALQGSLCAFACARSLRHPRLRWLGLFGMAVAVAGTVAWMQTSDLRSEAAGFSAGRGDDWTAELVLFGWTIACTLAALDVPRDVPWWALRTASAAFAALLCAGLAMLGGLSGGGELAPRIAIAILGILAIACIAAAAVLDAAHRNGSRTDPLGERLVLVREDASTFRDEAGRRYRVESLATDGGADAAR